MNEIYSFLLSLKLLPNCSYYEDEIISCQLYVNHVFGDRYFVDSSGDKSAYAKFLSDGLEIRVSI